MQFQPLAALEVVLPAKSSTSQAAPCPLLAAVKANAKALKKWRKNEHRRVFISWCASFHALGFCF